MQKRKAASIRAVVFDLDGTLVDSLADIAAAVNSALAGHGRPPRPVEDYKPMVGWGLKSLLVSATADQPLSSEAFERAFEDLMQYYRARPAVHTRAYPGIYALLERWKGHVPLGVLSNKEDGMTKTIVSELFPAVTFRAVWGARPGARHKPDPTSLLSILADWSVAPEQCAFLGDSGVDMETAVRAGAVACGASWGFRDAAELRASGAAEVFPAPSAFGSWLESHGPGSLDKSE